MKFPTQLSSLSGFQPELPEFQRCLKRRVTSNTLTENDIVRFAKNWTSGRMNHARSMQTYASRNGIAGYVSAGR